MNVLILQLLTNYDSDQCERQIQAVHRAISRPFKRAMHGRHNIAFVVKTPETSKELVERLADPLAATCFEAWFCQTAARDIVSSHGGLDSLRSGVMASYAEIENRRYPKNVRQLEIRRPRQFERRKDRIGDTAVKMLPKKDPER